jgi:hypothetical protein
LGPRRPPAWHRKTSYFTVPGPPVAPGSIPRGPAVALQGPTAAPWGPRQPMGPPLSRTATQEGGKNLVFDSVWGLPGPEALPQTPKNLVFYSVWGAWPLWGAPWCLAGPPAGTEKPSILQCLGRPWPQGGPRGDPPWPCKVPPQPRGARSRPPLGPTVTQEGAEKPSILQCLEPPCPETLPPDPQKLGQCLGRLPPLGCPWEPRRPPVSH